MHIPDGFLSTPVSVATYAVSAVTGGVAVYRAKKRFADRLVPMAGVCAAFIFAAQMMNFPISGGTSGHFLGAVLACVLLGPSVGFWVMTLVLAVQALLFADGGITALGANVMNMGLIGGVLVYFIFFGALKLLPKNKKSFISAVAVASWLSVVLAAAVCSLELAFSGTIPFGVVFPVMTTTHALIGIGEAIITTAVTAYVLSARPDLVFAWSEEPTLGLSKEVLADG
jgi:cobalt/nickel transport system permease protein